uniref:TauD/TfdA-like domain-containing protein n=1 Tax=Timema monikensis TaxID=170555 RepID=A0A7R9DZ90_9NEOP|nr:unnamed protein product [Timema monikensis]
MHQKEAQRHLVGDKTETDKPENYVLNGGSLLRWLTWKAGETYESIAKSYANFINLKYGKGTIWSEGEFIISDNLAVGHEATPETQLPRSTVGLRVLHRTTIKGTHPPDSLR